MSAIKSVFTIKDLENLSGIKAHTIRIWEKRYQVLQPMRTDTNIRFYDTENLQRLLNIALLNQYGYKISKISNLKKEQITPLVSEIVSSKSAKHHALSAFKLAMMNFDQDLFCSAYEKLLSEISFRQIFYDIFIPLIIEIGFLWQAQTINPAHEHFIAHLIKQKILSNTDASRRKPDTESERVYLLYLPYNELHELGLMYINYEILNCGGRTIYLGESIPLEALKNMKSHYNNITYICYVTVEPNKSEINDYVRKLQEEVLESSSKLWLIGRQTANVDSNLISEQIRTFKTIESLVNEITG